jgi:hypothetical protein
VSSICHHTLFVLESLELFLKRWHDSFIQPSKPSKLDKYIQPLWSFFFRISHCCWGCKLVLSEQVRQLAGLDNKARTEQALETSIMASLWP